MSIVITKELIPMKSITSLLAISAALLTSGNAVAAWQEIGQNDQSTVFVDTATLQTQDNLAQIMSMLDFKKPGQDPQTKENVNSIIGLNEYDCSTGKYRPIEFKVFTGNRGKGKVVADQKTPDSVFEAIPNGSWAAGVFNVACRSK
ncbi:surface-adhesin E family protein [Polynucleobacter ibericus]|uniref:surface-adhesin E family protein n=1 Tax=Polynucleobacter ibericus TaxID=1819725 RepID=UPI0020421603|nr:surface-adhesin E family protein [Polynucleobacter ibericus]